MQKILIVCGPTATGKTSLGVSLAKKFSGEIVSADSRQVYRGMDIGTGKDLPKSSKTQSLKNSRHHFYKVNGVRIWGYDLVGPSSEFSVAKYLKFAKKVIKEIRERGKLPILVGGTGFYIQAVTGHISTINIPKNRRLRNSLASKTPLELFEILAGLDSTRAGNLNVSDKNNPRRLVRSIEVAQYLITNGSKKEKVSKYDDVLFVGLYAPTEVIEKKINERVDARVRKGVVEEVKSLLKSGISWGDQSMSSLGYRQWRGYIDGQVEEQKVIEEWKSEERKYVRRQLTWFKKDKRINWIDVSKKNYQKNVEKLVKKWYSGP